MLKEIRESRGMSQQDLADKSGINKRIIQAYEQGYRKINGAKLTTLVTICSALECHLSEIVDDAQLVKDLKAYEALEKQYSKDEAIAAWNRRAGKDTNVTTNADRIRGMTDEELAEWLVDANMCERVCIEEDYCGCDVCVNRVTDWLKQPAREEHNETD